MSSPVLPAEEGRMYKPILVTCDPASSPVLPARGLSSCEQVEKTAKNIRKFNR